MTTRRKLVAAMLAGVAAPGTNNRLSSLTLSQICVVQKTNTFYTLYEEDALTNSEHNPFAGRCLSRKTRLTES